MRALALAKAYHPKMDPALLAGGFPELKADNTPFGKSDYARVMKETQQHATTTAHGLDLTSFQVRYDEENQHMELPNPEPFGLEPPHKQTPPPVAPSSTTPTIPAPLMASSGAEEDDIIL